MARYEKHDSESGKFWEITIKGSVVSTRTGKIGAGASRDRDGNLYLYDRRGRTTDRTFSDADTAQREHDRLVKGKLKEGFRLVDAGAAPAVAIEIHINAELESAIAAAPDDDAAYLVYADWLISRADPRGELITLQHAMRGQQDPAKFMTYKKQEEALRTAHLRSWLGDIAGPALHRLKLDWRNGFFHGVRIDQPENATEVSLRELTVAVLECPLARFVRELGLRGTMGNVADAVPDHPPPLLTKLALIAHRWDSDDADRPRLDVHCAHYRSSGIVAEIASYSPDERYVAMRE